MPLPQPDHEHRTFLSDEVRDRVRDSIVTGELRPGEILSESALMRHFGVSRTTLRRALSDLTASGLVENTPNRSPRVTSPEAADVPDAFITLGILMRGVMQFSVASLDGREQQWQLDGVSRVIDAIERHDTDFLARETVEGYHRWADSCRNRFLASTLHRRADALSNTIVTTGSTPRRQAVLSGLGLLRFGVRDNDPRTSVVAIETMHAAQVVPNGLEENLRAADAARWSPRATKASTREG